MKRFIFNESNHYDIKSSEDRRSPSLSFKTELVHKKTKMQKS